MPVDPLKMIASEGSIDGTEEPEVYQKVAGNGYISQRVSTKKDVRCIAATSLPAFCG